MSDSVNQPSCSRFCVKLTGWFSGAFGRTGEYTWLPLDARPLVKLGSGFEARFQISRISVSCQVVRNARTEAPGGAFKSSGRWTLESENHRGRHLEDSTILGRRPPTSTQPDEVGDGEGRWWGVANESKAGTWGLVLLLYPDFTYITQGLEGDWCKIIRLPSPGPASTDPSALPPYGEKRRVKESVRENREDNSRLRGF